MPFLIPAGLAGAAAGGGSATAGALAAGTVATEAAAGAGVAGSIGAGTAAAIDAATVAGLSTSAFTATNVLGGISLASSLVSSAGSLLQGNYQKSASNAQNAELKQQSDLDTAAAASKMSSDDYKATQLIGAISANTAGSGVTPEGSPGLVSRTSIQEQKISDTYTRYSGQLASMRDLYKATIATNEGKQQFQAGVIGAVGGLLTSGVRTAGIFSGNFANPYVGLI